MSNGTLTKHERDVVIVVEKTLNSMILTRLTLAEIIDAAAVSALRSQNALRQEDPRQVRVSLHASNWFPRK